MQQKQRPRVLLGIACLLLGLLLLVLMPSKHQAAASIAEQTAHRYNMSPEQTAQFVKAIVPRLGWKLESQEGNILVAQTPRFFLEPPCRVEIKVQNTEMGEAAYVEILSQSEQGLVEAGGNQKNIRKLQEAMDEKLPQTSTRTSTQK